MVILRTETFSDCNNNHFKRTFYLYSLLKKNNSITLAVDNPKVVESHLKGKSVPIFHKGESSLLSVKPHTIIFDLFEMNEGDLRLANEALGKGINTVQIIEQPQEILTGAFHIYQNISPLFDNPIDKNFLYGPENIILHNRFIHFNRVKKKYRKNPRRIFLSLNSTFSYREVRDISDNLIRHGFLLKIAPGNYLKKFNKKTLRRIYPGLKFTGKRDNLARAFFEADISITNADVSLYESIATGTPSISLFNSENERKISTDLEKRGTCIAVKRGKFLYSKGFIDLINEKFSYENIKEMGKNGKNLIDGKGVYRVINSLSEKKII